MRQLLETHAEGGARRRGRRWLGELDTELVEDRIYVLTPKGEVIDLPAGATPLDFAYHVHTEVGHRCRGAKVDGRIVPLDHKLHSGDRVEIMTAKTGEPRRDWLVAANGFLASSAFAREGAQLVPQARPRAQRAGRPRTARQGTASASACSHADLAPALQKFNAGSDDDLHVLVALGDVGPHQVGRVPARTRARRDCARRAPALPRPRAPPRGAAQVIGIHGRGVGNLLVQLARCCQPLPGEPIAGYLTRGRGVSVHRADCATFLRLSAAQPQRVLPVEWGRAGQRLRSRRRGAGARPQMAAEGRHQPDRAGQTRTSLGIHSETGARRRRVRLRLRLRVADYRPAVAPAGQARGLPGVEHAQRG